MSAAARPLSIRIRRALLSCGQLKQIAGPALKRVAQLLDGAEARVIARPGRERLQRIYGNCSSLGQYCVSQALPCTAPVRLHRVAKLDLDHEICIDSTASLPHDSRCTMRLRNMRTKARKPRMLKTISLFSGIGGLDF